MGHQHHISSSFLFCLIAVLFTVCSSDEQVKSDGTFGGVQVSDGTKPLSKEELGEKIKDLLLKRPERPDSPDFDTEFEKLFEELDSLAVKLTDDFEFDVKLYGPPEGHPTQRNIKAMKCLNTPSQFKHFMHRVHEILQKVKEEYLDDIQDSKENEDKLNSRDNDININQNTDDSDNNSTNDSRDRDTTVSTTDLPDSSQDSRDNDTIIQDTVKPKDSGTKNTDDHTRHRRDTKLQIFDLDEILDRLEDDDVECLAGFISEGDKKFLCHRFTHRSSGIFGKIMAAGAKCDDYLIDDDDDDDDHLDESHQLTILKIFKEKESKEVDDDDIKKILRLAPDVIDDDFLEDLSEELFKQNLHRLGQLATGCNTNPRLRYALRKRLNDFDLSKLSTDDIRNIGPGLFSLSLDQIQALNVKLLLDTDIDGGDSGEQKKPEKTDDDDDDDDVDEDVKRAIGHRIKEMIRQSGLQKQQIGRTMRYLHDDLDFVDSVEPDDLFDALDDIRKINYDFHDAQSVLYRLTKASRFPSISMLSGHNLTHIGKLMRGMDAELLSMLNKESIEDALDDIKDIDFDDYQAYQLLENMGYTKDQQNYENFNALQVKKLGKLFRGMPAASIALMKGDAIEEALDDLDDLDLSDALKNAIVEKARHNDKISLKFLSLKNFAEVISLDDLDDFDDDDLRLYLNTSSNIRWRLPQAALLAHRYKIAKGSGRMRPSHLAQMKQLAFGLLPDDLDEMISTQDDVLDIAEELKDLHEDLTSGQIDELIENFIELSGLDKTKVVIDESEAMQAAHVLAYLTPELFEKLEFTKAGKMAFVYQVAKMSTHKMSREHVQYLASKMLDMLEDMDSAESKNEKSDDSESRRLRSLGQMTLGLTPSQFSGISGKAIIDNMGLIRTLALTKLQAKAVLKKIEDTIENWKCNSNIMARVGPLLQYHDDPFSDDCDDNYREDQLDTLLAIVKDIDKRRDAIQERLDEGFAKEDDDDIIDDTRENILVDAAVAVATQKINVRTRRATHANGGHLTCNILIRLGRSARLINLELLKAVPNEELKKCLPQLGAVGGWSQEMLNVLAEKLKLIYPGISSWSAKTVAAAGSIIAGLSPAEIQTLNSLNGVDIMHSIGRHRKLSNEQLKAGFRRWMELNKKNHVSDITGVELSSLSEFVCGLEAAEINKLNDLTFKRSLNTIGQSTSCTHEQRQAYLNKARAVYGSQISQWTPEVVADMGYLLGSLSNDQMKLLSSKQLALISPKIIQTLSNDGMAAMSVAQLMSLSTNQANAVTHTQYEALTAEQQKVVGSKATIDFNKHNKSGGNNGNGTASKGTYYSILISTTVLLASMLL